MNIVQFAQQQEEQVATHYEQLADLAPHAAIKELLLHLAQDEKHHGECLSMSQQGRFNQSSSCLDLSHCVALIKMAETANDWGMDFTELDQYQRARDVELQLERFYLDSACETENPSERQFYQKMAQEEHHHFMVMDNLCSLMARRITHISRSYKEKQPQYVAMWD